ncbi:hypothetical protein PRUPE_2G119900 [Prunus persica]|uniref:Disease resistance protein At1g50180 n=1 Tax=Prunus persica TaxID=3760 RepID=M5XH13_PRUPE|nr:putative disease resistance protein At1g50180 [Prunus persica]XP_020413591.1 putative disease resistance protein At1g50180 [Prunus persica]ONI22298.1 hypothetical protein PRUPE_2G119900 [Prunus persica]
MAEAVVSFVLELLKDCVIPELKFLGGVSDQVKLAQTQLQLMQCFLKDADSRQGESEAIRIWVANIRDVAYDLDDAIETFVLKVASKRNASLLKRFTGIFIKRVHLHQIGSDIVKITTRISQLNSSLQSYNLHQTRESRGDTFFQRQKERRIAYPHIIEPHVVGLTGGTEILATHLIKKNGPRVVSIWGMGGLGKTTLAKQVYHHGKVKCHFDCFAWVCISQQCQGREVLEEILTKLISPTNEQREEIAKLKKDQIAERLWITQRERKCLVVLDDIWSRDAWRSLEAGFPMNEETESRILLTTRNKEVASYADKNGFLFEPQPLNDDESWELFKKIAMFGTEDIDQEIYEQKKELGTEMLQHCKGLPLAITVLAGLLARKETIDEWDMVHKNVYEYIRRGRDLGSDYKDEGYEGVSWLLELSYDNLPYYLKLCFLYLAHFPEDCEIPVSTLTKLWMAEGFISSAAVEVMEDVSYMCLSELVGRCMVQVGKHGSSKKIKTCHLHDLMRDLCILKAKEGNFLHIINYSASVEIKQTPNGRVRRLVIHLNEPFEAYCLGRDENYGYVRSLLYFVPIDPYYYCYWNSKALRSLLRDFTLLRVLKLENTSTGEKLPGEIGNLVHLRFLSVRDSAIQAVPSSIANLVCLQTLDLRIRVGYVKIPNPNVFCKMEKLRHIYLPKYQGPREKHLLFATEAVNLNTVVNIGIQASSDLDDFVKLTNLRKLGVMIFDGGEKKEKGTNIIFKHLHSLSVDSIFVAVPWNIILSSPNIYKLRLRGKIRELPEDLLCLRNLTKLTLSGFGNLKDDHIKVLEKLPSLRMLFASVGIFQASLVCSEGGFPFLEFLSLYSLLEFKEWKVEKGAMPSLCRLHIEYCPDLEAVPDGLQYITTLKELTIKRMLSEFCSRLGEGGEDFYKIQHVQSVIITNISPNRPG